MPLEDENTYSNALQSVAKIVSVYLEQSAELKPDQLVSLVENVLNVLHQRAPSSGSSMPNGDLASVTAGSSPVDAPAAPKPLTPAVPVGESIAPDYLICLEDGNKVKLLKRYLRSKYDLTPRQYREKWGLPKDYPMVAPSYSEKRTQIARASGLGARRPEAATPAPAAAPEARSEVEAPTPPPAKKAAPKSRAAAAKTSTPTASKAPAPPKKAAEPYNSAPKASTRAKRK